MTKMSANAAMAPNCSWISSVSSDSPSAHGVQRRSESSFQPWMHRLQSTPR